MGTEQALRILRAANTAFYATLDPRLEVPAWLADVELFEMLEAKLIISELREKAGPGTSAEQIEGRPCPIPSDRLIAAVYCMLNFDAQPGPVATDGRGVEVIVRRVPSAAKSVHVQQEGPANDG